MNPLSSRRTEENGNWLAMKIDTIHIDAGKTELFAFESQYVCH